MYWVIQDNFYKETEYDRMVELLERANISHTFVKVVPFSHELITDCMPTGNVFVVGATTMIKIAREHGWIPGAFFNENFDFRVWQQHYGNHLLNHDAEVFKFGEIPLDRMPEMFFIRPCKDSKTFTGYVAEKSTFNDWRESVLNIEGYSTLTNETEVIVSSPKKILREYRFFVVDKKIVTQSLYKIGNTPHSDANVDEDIIQYAQQMIDIWVPDRAFVIDIAMTDEGNKIVEINCFNSSGFYACDAYKIVEAIENMTF